MLHPQWKTPRGEKGYPWLFWHVGPSWSAGLLVTLLVIGISGAFYVWYSHSGNDTAPDSAAGYCYAIMGLICFALAATLYTIHRRSHNTAAGQLNAILNWHIFFAVMGLALLLMHSFGNFEAKSGTYALYSLIALTVSGFVGRALDRFVPRLMAMEVDKVLTAQGEDRVEAILQGLQARMLHQRAYGPRTPSPDIEVQTRQRLSTTSDRLFLRGEQTWHAPWDLEYIALEAPQEVGQRKESHYHFAPIPAGSLMPEAQEHIEALQLLHQAMQREQFYRYIIRYWRVVHIALAMLTIGLIIWHLIYVAQLLIPTL